jgi:transcriptional regulator with XRE-family HTH domain
MGDQTGSLVSKRRRGRPRGGHDRPDAPKRLPDDFYDRADVRRLLAGHRFGEFLHLVRMVTGWTQESLAERLELSQQRLSEYERGIGGTVRTQTLRRLVRMLDIPAGLLFPVDADQEFDGQAADGEAPEGPGSVLRRDVLQMVAGTVLGSAGAVSLRELLPAVAPRVPTRLGMADVARIERVSLGQRDADHRGVGGLALAELDARVRWVVHAAETASCSPAVRERLLAATADAASVAAWAHYDVDEHVTAQRLWEVALRAGRESGRVDLVAGILRLCAHLCLHQDKPVEALRVLQLADTCLDSGADGADGSRVRRAAAVMRSQLHAYQGWCYAALGRADDCEAALASAQRRLDDAERDGPGDGPGSGRGGEPWLRSYGRTELTALRGHSWHVLARVRPGEERRKYAGRAVPLLAQAVAERGPGYARSAVLNTIAWSAALFDAGEPERATAVGHHALRQVGTVPSRRTYDRLPTLESASRPYQTETATAGLRDQIARLTGASS